MNTYEQLRADLKQSMIEKDSSRTSVVRMLISSIRNKEIEKGDSLSEDDVISVIRTEGKKVVDSIEQFEAAGRTDLSEKEKHDLSVIEAYLPKLLDEDATRALVKSAISDSSACGMKDMGKVMGMLMAKHQSELDGGLASRLVKEELSKI